MKISWVCFLFVNTLHHTYRNTQILKGEKVPGGQGRLKFERAGRKVGVSKTSKKRNMGSEIYSSSLLKRIQNLSRIKHPA